MRIFQSTAISANRIPTNCVFPPFLKRSLIKAGVKAGIPVEQQRKDPVAWQMDLLKKDYLLFDQLADRGSRKIVLTDTSFIETVVFAARAGIEMGPAVESWIQTKRYFLVITI